ncbi:MAG: hypothetical protein DRJ40_00175 [Thermoprotei archaeon]|nr:MAG: hypothetical protein DRJ40_00175 [Thermoprotei archaeon]
MRMSIYEFPNTYQLYVIVELTTENEKTTLDNYLSNTSTLEKKLQNFMKSIDARYWKVAHGVAHFDKELPYTYIEFEVETNYTTYRIELLPSSITLVTNSTPHEAVKVLEQLLEHVLNIEFTSAKSQ